jgi:serine/threonine-protein kinase HipA
MNSVKRCLFCYALLGDESGDFHPACSRKMFGSTQPPELQYSEADMLRLALQVVRSRIAVTGVQAKLSLELEQAVKTVRTQRFTIVGMWGRYTLKPPTPQYPYLPEVEDCTMHLATLAGLRTVPHSLIRMPSGKLAYITARIDRTKEGMLHMEDMCQITGRLTEHKYLGSHEQIARALIRYSANPLLDVGIFYEQVLFSFLTGNADMHLKNFSLIDSPGIGYALAPAYDMVATALVNPKDTEELALTLDGKKRSISRRSFENACYIAGLNEKSVGAIFRRFEKAIPRWLEFIGISFLPEVLKEEFRAIIKQRAGRVGLW